MAKSFFCVLLILMLFSCSKNEENDLYGNWYFDKELPSERLKEYPNHYVSNLSFEILKGGNIKFKQGFYHFVSLRASKTDFVRSFYYLGNETKYTFKNNLLVYQDLTNNDLDTLTIVNFNATELIIQDTEKRKYLLKKKVPQIFNHNFSDYDAIVVENGACFGSCPINSTYLHKNGDFIFTGEQHNTINENFYCKLNGTTVSKIFHDFSKVDIKSLNNNYFKPVTCSKSTSISFLKNGKIIKTIRDYAESAPIDLLLAMEELSYLYQKAEVNNLEDNLFDAELKMGGFKNNKINYRLNDSEFSYLQICLNRAKKTQTSFTEKYRLTFIEPQFVYKEGKIKNIFTDGRHYKINYLDNTTTTVDLGYNFIEQNPIITQKRIE
ncbi:DUF6438 domain-containing protein [Flavobacterium sp.]|uniref:DUF6438 domain-containing protein n=1 Tax=Flavobacterium sp. TaxID=239 RepID=UPI0028BDB42D|nr:DUF6438 domain-containing protein [Flavobacterium sp.]